MMGSKDLAWVRKSSIQLITQTKMQRKIGEMRKDVEEDIFEEEVMVKCFQN